MKTDDKGLRQQFCVDMQQQMKQIISVWWKTGLQWWGYFSHEWQSEQAKCSNLEHWTNSKIQFVCHHSCKRMRNAQTILGIITFGFHCAGLIGDAFAETIHIVHTLQEIISSFMAGRPTRTGNIIFLLTVSIARGKTTSLSTYYIEFQKRDISHIGVARIFDWGGGKLQITCNDTIRNFQKRIFWGA